MELIQDFRAITNITRLNKCTAHTVTLHECYVVNINLQASSEEDAIMLELIHPFHLSLINSFYKVERHTFVVSLS